MQEEEVSQNRKMQFIKRCIKITLFIEKPVSYIN